MHRSALSGLQQRGGLGEVERLGRASGAAGGNLDHEGHVAADPIPADIAGDGAAEDGQESLQRGPAERVRLGFEPLIDFVTGQVGELPGAQLRDDVGPGEGGAVVDGALAAAAETVGEPRLEAVCDRVALDGGIALVSAAQQFLELVLGLRLGLSRGGPHDPLAIRTEAELCSSDPAFAPGAVMVVLLLTRFVLITSITGHYRSRAVGTRPGRTMPGARHPHVTITSRVPRPALSASRSVARGATAYGAQLPRRLAPAAWHRTLP